MNLSVNALEGVHPCVSGRIDLRAGGKVVILAAALLAAPLSAISSDAVATILTFDQARSATGSTVVPTQAGSAVPQDYGDRVSSPSMTVPGGEFTYGNGGEGFTPNVVVDYFSGINVSLWTIQYGDLTNVMFASPGSDVMNLRLTADPGFEVLLYGFDIAGWPQTDYLINVVGVTSGATSLFFQSDVLVEGDATGPGHTSFDFTSPLTGLDLLIGIDFANIAFGQQDNIGIDNIRFGQSPPAMTNSMPVPEPGAMALFGLGLVVLGFLRRSRRTDARDS